MNRKISRKRGLAQKATSYPVWKREVSITALFGKKIQKNNFLRILQIKLKVKEIIQNEKRDWGTLLANCTKKAYCI